MPRHVPRSLTLVAMFAVLAVGVCLAAPPDAEVPFVRLDTEEGTILVALFPDLAPHHAANFRHLAETGFYDGTMFHRVVPGFVIQGGDPNSKNENPGDDGLGGPTLADVLDAGSQAAVRAAAEALAPWDNRAPGLGDRALLKAEFSGTAKHLRGTLSMARSNDVDSAGSQFFVCVAPTPQLDGQYTIFGHVVTGMDVADRIVSAETGTGRNAQRPLVPVQLIRCEVTTGVSSLSAEDQAAYREMLATLDAEGSTW